MWLLKKLWACVQYLSAGSQEELLPKAQPTCTIVLVWGQNAFLRVLMASLVVQVMQNVI